MRFLSNGLNRSVPTLIEELKSVLQGKEEFEYQNKSVPKVLSSEDENSNAENKMMYIAYKVHLK